MDCIEYINNNKLNELLYFENKNYYYNHKLVNKKLIIKILNNRNIYTRIKPIKALIISRCYGKKLPSNIILYNKINDNYFDRNQLTELNIGLPVYIIHISKDKNWYFIKTYNYYCWINKKYICKVNNQLFYKYLHPNNFIITTNRLYLNSNIFLEMGVKLPLYKRLKYTTKIYLPTKYKNTIKEKIIEINNNFICINYLKYTNKNIYIQAIKYLNVNYGWGGINNGVDCSSLIVNVYKVFGLYLPRDTSKQQEIVGTNIINTTNLNFIEKYKLLTSINRPALIYLRGHVMLFLKYTNKRIYVIHASSIYMKVIISILDNKTIDKICSIHFINV